MRETECSAIHMYTCMSVRPQANVFCTWGEREQTMILCLNRCTRYNIQQFDCVYVLTCSQWCWEWRVSSAAQVLWVAPSVGCHAWTAPLERCIYQSRRGGVEGEERKEEEGRRRGEEEEREERIEMNVLQQLHKESSKTHTYMHV